MHCGRVLVEGELEEAKSEEKLVHCVAYIGTEDISIPYNLHSRRFTTEVSEESRFSVGLIKTVVPETMFFALA